jgi:tetratricopeptide (TPR) repeat protein
MYNVRNHALCVTLLVVCHTFTFAQPIDLSPLLPAPDTSTQAIREALQSGQVWRASALLASLDPSNRYLWEGILAITQNDAHKAIRSLRKADNPKALGVAYYLAGQHLLFRDQMLEAIRRDPTDFGPYYYLGRHYDSDVDNAAEAVRWLRLSLQRKGDYAVAHSYLGNCLERLGRITEAEAAFHASAEIAESQLGLARLRFTAGDASSALAFIEKAIAFEPRNVRALKLAARIYGALSRPNDVVRALEFAAAGAPRDASIRYQLARAYKTIGDQTKSTAAMQEFQRLRSIYGANQ